MRQLFALLLTTVAASPALADCMSARTDLQNTFLSAPIGELADKAQGLGLAGCPESVVRASLLATSSVAARRANGLLSNGDADGAEALLNAAPVMHWEVLAVRGALAAFKQDFSGAAESFNLALDTLGAPDLTPQDPRLEPAAHRLMALAQENMMLAGSADASMRADGSMSGVMKAMNDSISSRGLAPMAQTQDYNVVTSAAAQVERVFLPVRFQTDSHELDDSGLAEAKALAAYLRNLPADVTLTITGHTDDMGTEDYNMALSMKRAETVRDFLRNRGVGMTIQIAGRGEYEPPSILEPDGYSEDQKRAIARRVEVAFDIQ